MSQNNSEGEGNREAAGFKKRLKVCLYCARYHDEAFKVRPLGISYLASYLLQKGIIADDLKIVDNLEEAIAFQPDLIGVSSVSHVIADAREFAYKIKKETGCFTVLGGYHISSVPGLLPNEFDVGVIGEGEETFAEIVEKSYPNHPRQLQNSSFLRSHPEKPTFTQLGAVAPDPISPLGLQLADHLTESVLGGILGICYRDRQGLIKQTQPREHITDIDSIPWPLRHKVYSSEEPIFTSRGCPFSCTFCASQKFWRGSTRFRSADSVVREIEQLVEQHQPKEIAILDDLWMADKPRFRNIVHQLVKLGIPQKVSFRGFCRSNIIDEEAILLFKDLNYRFVRFGAETGSERLLRKIKGTNISIEDHQRVIDLCRRHGLPCGASFMFGIPGETINDLQNTIHFLRRNKKHFKIIGFYLFNPIPGTILWEELEQKGLVSNDFKFDRLQLDLLKTKFSWDEVLYFNSDNIPLEIFRSIITNIRGEFVDDFLGREVGAKNWCANFLGQAVQMAKRKMHTRKK